MNKKEPMFSKVLKDDLDDIMAIEAENFGCDAFSRSQFIYALKNKRAVFIKAETPGGTKQEIAGYALGFTRRTGRGESDRLSGRLYSIAVAIKAQGMSIGKKLLSEFERLMKARKCVNIYLEVRTDNAAAIKMYENSGYKKLGTVENYYHDLSPAFKYVKTL